MKKIILLLTVAVTILSCNKVKKGEFLVEGNAPGIADGKTAIIQKQDEMLGMVALDTVKIKGGKFVLTGKIEEPTICAVTIQDIQGQIILIAESEKVTVQVDKDSIFKSKVGGSYNNEQFTKFNEDMKVAQKKFVAADKAFKEKYKAEIASLQTNQDPAIMQKLNAEYAPIQEEGQKVSKDKMNAYAEANNKAFISVLIIEGMFKSQGQDFDFAKAKKMYENLTTELKNTKPGKSIKMMIDNYKKPQAAPVVGPQAPAAAPSTAP